MIVTHVAPPGAAPFAMVRTVTRSSVCALAALLFVACGRGAGSDEGAQPIVRQGARLIIPATSPLRTQLQVDSVATARIRQEFSATASVEADPAHVAHVVPPLAGRVVAIHVRVGDVVSAGQGLVTIDSPDFATAIADYRRAQSGLAQAQRTRDRQVDLHDKGVAAVRDVEQAETDLAQARSEFDRAAARLQTLGVDPAATTSARTLEMRAPIAGIVEEVTASEGEFRNDASAPLMTIADLSTVWLTANVPEKDIHAVSKGQPIDAVFAAYPGEGFHGTVLQIGNLLDPDTRSAKVRVAVPNPTTRFKPGMFATVRFLGPAEEAILVPTAAVVQLRDSTYVYAEVAPWTFEARPVAIGAQQGDRTVIHSGVAKGNRIVVRGALLLQ
jgi:membrane fusion protein, heavy metal efflux system